MRVFSETMRDRPNIFTKVLYPDGRDGALGGMASSDLLQDSSESEAEPSATPAHDDGPDEDDERLVFNVGGHRHEALLSTLLRRPGTRLCQVASRHAPGHTAEYFFDRHPGVFDAVMDYYRSGDLHVPLNVCGAVVKRELDYWQLDESLIMPCCWTSYSCYIDNQKTLAEFTASIAKENEKLAGYENLEGWERTKMKIWVTLDHPRSSRPAMAVAVTSFAFVVASIGGFCLETLPILHIPVNVTRHCQGEEIESTPFFASHPLLEFLDYVCTAFFSLELIVRIIFAPKKLVFFKSFMNIIDILALLPLYAQIILQLTDKYSCLSSDQAVLETIFILRIVRIFRIFHLVKHYKALKILVHAIKASVQELLMLAIFLVIAMLVFATLIFYAESPNPMAQTVYEGDFSTIPYGFWWAITTMTTVGYGDLCPQTPVGYVVGALCAVSGVLLVALTIPVISHNFSLFYLHARTRETITQCRQERQMKLMAATKRRARRKRTPPDMRVLAAKRPGLTHPLLTSMDSTSMTDDTGSARPDEPVSMNGIRDPRQLGPVPLAPKDESAM